MPWHNSYLPVEGITRYEKSHIIFPTRKKKPDDDWYEKWVLKYLSEARHLKLTLMVKPVAKIRWYLDALCATYEDCKGSRTGDIISFSWR